MPQAQTILCATSDTPFCVILNRVLYSMKVTQQDLAERLGVTPGRVSQLLRQENLSEETFLRCLRALGLKVIIEVVEEVEAPLDDWTLDQTIAAIERGDGAAMHKLQKEILSALRELRHRRTE